MRIVFPFLLLAGFLTACDNTRVYEKNHDFDQRHWLVNDTTTFEFEIPDTTLHYNLYCNLRNTVAFPYARLFVNYHLEDSTGKPLQKRLIQTFLFDQHTGKPQGTSGLGDIYDHRIRLIGNHRFPYAGKYNMRFEQYMRTDTLEGILAVGLRVEKVLPE
jgi:gliding motility-associated lipoprotein GldH